MNINFNNYKNKAIDWFHAHKREIKVGAYCLAAGLVYGTVKGIISGVEIESDHVNRLIAKIPDAAIHLPTGEKEITDWFLNIEDDDFDTIQRLVHEAE